MPRYNGDKQVQRGEITNGRIVSCRMISIERTRELLGKTAKDCTDAEIEEIRDTTQSMVELIFDQWMADQKKAREEAKAEEPNEKKESDL